LVEKDLRQLGVSKKVIDGARFKPGKPRPGCGDDLFALLGCKSSELRARIRHAFHYDPSTRSSSTMSFELELELETNTVTGATGATTGRPSKTPGYIDDAVGLELVELGERTELQMRRGRWRSRSTIDC
jgi:hypothetical protein